MIDRLVKCEGQFAAGIEISEQHVGDGVATLLAKEPGFDDGGDVLIHPVNGQSAAIHQHTHGFGIRFHDFFYQFFLHARQIQIRAIYALVLNIEIRAQDHDDHVCLLGHVRRGAELLRIGFHPAQTHGGFVPMLQKL